MTRALRELVRAHDQDQEFPYLDFLGAFVLMERWATHTRGQALRRLTDAEASDLLGLPLGQSADDIKLGYVMILLRRHGIEIVEALMRGEQQVAAAPH